MKQDILQVALLLILVTTTIMAQMVTYDLTVGEFYIECSTGSYCVFSKGEELAGENGASFLQFGPTESVEEDDNRFTPSVAYYFKGDDGFIGGLGCNSEFCHATCDEAVCTCVSDPTITDTPETDGNGTSWTYTPNLTTDSAQAVPCTIDATLPNVSIAEPSELVAYQGSVQSPGFLSLRCREQFATCSPVLSSESYFTSTIFQAEDDFFYARDVTDCSNPPDGICYVACDPRCTCTETLSDDSSSSEPQPCATGIPPTEAPSMAPTISPSPTAAAGDSSSSSSSSSAKQAASFGFLGMLLASVAGSAFVEIGLLCL